MPVTLDPHGQPTAWRRRTGAQTLLAWSGWLILVAVGVVAAKLIVDGTLWQNITPARLLTGWRDMMQRAFPPDWSHMRAVLWPLWQTINIATLGTLLAVAIALPVALLAARPTSPHPLARWSALGIIAGSRSVNSLIWALLLVEVVGAGEFAGVIAIALRSVGFVGKLLYEAIEEASHLPPEAIRATGATSLQVVAWGIWPQVRPAYWSIVLLRWDINIRESLIVGLVGGGGLGLTLHEAMMELRWNRVSLILLVILVLVLLGESISSRIRRRLV